MATGSRLETLPYDWYTDASVLHREHARIFARSWQYVARADQVAEPGSFVAVTVGEIPVVVTRDTGGTLRGFVNVCRHRGFVLCEGSGRRETLQCPYHAWTYALDGRLRNAPRASVEAGLDVEGVTLEPVSVAVWGPFVFANPDPDAGPLEDWLGDVPSHLAAAGVDLDRLVFHTHAEPPEYRCNWKVCVENFLECYHCQVAHPRLAKAVDVSADAYLLETGRWTSTQHGPPKNGGGGVYDARGEVARGQFHFLFPSTVINAMPGPLNLSIGPILPRGVDRSVRFLDYFYGADLDDDWLRDFLVLDAEVGDEDRILVERLQRGLGNGVVASGQLMPRSELLIAHFQGLVADALGRA